MLWFGMMREGPRAVMMKKVNVMAVFGDGDMA